ncbi:MAG TPA: hypothetical protein VH372_04675 [Actinospica sp.]|nr:hypothetical protein [Actinospica sp.]
MAVLREQATGRPVTLAFTDEDGNPVDSAGVELIKRRLSEPAA